ncbi:MAG: hypothetical protein IOD12_14045 [Silvanigrellales bacterium]|jgi:hypothetical protein|nr:hypothetical protein [Silvanigrellales bacterium]
MTEPTLPPPPALDLSSGSPALAPGFLSPTGPADIQTIQEELRASLAKPSESARPSPLREVDPSGFAARVHWPFSGRTLGSDRGFRFETGELTSHALHIRCQDFSRTFFKAGSTIIQARLFVPKQLLTGEGTPVDFVAFEFLAKVVKEVKHVEGQSPSDAGFLLNILQIDESLRHTLEELLLRLRSEPEDTTDSRASVTGTSLRLGASAR